MYAHTRDVVDARLARPHDVGDFAPSPPVRAEAWGIVHDGVVAGLGRGERHSPEHRRAAALLHDTYRMASYDAHKKVCKQRCTTALLHGGT